ncbi:hypothetical protein STENO_004096 [Stenotrophomonas maltophilia]
MADIAVAGHQPGAVAVDAGGGDVDEAAVDLCLVAQEDVEDAVDSSCVETDIAGKPRIIHVESYVAGTWRRSAGAGIDLQQIAVAAMQLSAITDVDDEVCRLCGGYPNRGTTPGRDRGPIDVELGHVGRVQRSMHQHAHIVRIDVRSVDDADLTILHAHAQAAGDIVSCGRVFHADVGGIDDGPCTGLSCFVRRGTHRKSDAEGGGW